MKDRDGESKKNTEKKDSANFGWQPVNPILSKHIDFHNDFVRKSSPEQYLKCSGLFILYNRRLRKAPNHSFDTPKSINEVELDIIHQSLSKCLNPSGKKK